MNGQIFITAAIVTVIVLIPIIILQLVLKFDWKIYWLLIVIMLPGSAIINLGVKNWIFLGLSHWDPTSQFVLFLVYFPLCVIIVGITEELIKVIPIGFPFLRKKMLDSKLFTLQVGWCLGCGFGIGEVWYLAFFIATDSTVATLRWFEFGGFLLERSLVVFVHAGMTILAVYGILKRKFWLTILFAILVHAVIDYIAIVSSFVFEIYYLFIAIAIIEFLLIALVFVSARSEEKTKRWRETVQETPIVDKPTDAGEVKSMFPEKSPENP